MDLATPHLSALDFIRADIGRIPLENISTLARDRLGDPDIIPLWFGESDIPAPAFIGDAMAEAVADGQVFYCHQNGVLALREALSAYHAMLGATGIGTDRITVTTSGMHALMMSVLMTAGPGDNVVIIDPVWPNMAGAARLAGAEVRSVRMDEGPEGWRIDLDRLAAAMDERTRLVFFASPGNPTGVVVPIETQRAMLAMTRERGAWLVADEVYNRMEFDGRCAPSLLAEADPEDRLIVVNSFSKSWAMTGWRIGWMVHPASLGPTLAMTTQYSNSGVATFIQHAGVAAVTRGEAFVSRMRAYCAEGMDIVCDALAASPRVRLSEKPRAGMFAFFQVEGMEDSRAACVEILERTKVGLAPGAFFGPGSGSHLRICVARSPAVLRKAMERLETVFS